MQSWQLTCSLTAEQHRAEHAVGDHLVEALVGEGR